MSLNVTNCHRAGQEKAPGPVGFIIIILLSLSLFACATQIETDSQALAQATVFAQEAGGAAIALPDEAAALAASTPADSSGAAPLVVYEKSGSLWIWQDRSATRLTNGDQDSRPRISTDGQVLAFQRGAELWMVDGSGQNLRRVFAEQGAQPWQFEFAPGSHLLYFSASAANGTPRFDLYQADPESNVYHVLLTEGQGGRFTFAPNASLLALVQADKIMTARPDGSALKPVFEFNAVEAAQADYYPPVVWLDNAYGFKTVIPGDAGQLARLMFLMADGGPAAQLAEFPAVSTVISDVFIAPNGTKVAYLCEQDGDLALHVMDASTADQAYFTHARGKIGLLGWTPDSQSPTYWLDDPRSAWISTDGNQALLAEAGFAENLSWLSADRYLFISEGELRLRRLGEPGQLIDRGVGSFAAILLR